jgi:hypothetical protein
MTTTGGCMGVGGASTTVGLIADTEDWILTGEQPTASFTINAIDIFK